MGRRSNNRQDQRSDGECQRITSEVHIVSRTDLIGCFFLLYCFILLTRHPMWHVHIIQSRLLIIKKQAGLFVFNMASSTEKA